MLWMIFLGRIKKCLIFVNKLYLFKETGKRKLGNKKNYDFGDR